MWPDEQLELRVPLAELEPRDATPEQDVPRHPRLLEAPALDDQLVSHAARGRHGSSDGSRAALAQANTAEAHCEYVARNHQQQQQQQAWGL